MAFYREKRGGKRGLKNEKKAAWEETKRLQCLESVAGESNRE